jgi:hypothetical protein
MRASAESAPLPVALVLSGRRRSRPNRVRSALIRSRRWQEEFVAGEDLRIDCQVLRRKCNTERMRHINPTGKSARFRKNLSSPRAKNKPLRFFRNQPYKSAVPPPEGRIAIVTNVGRDAVDAMASARDSTLQGGPSCKAS